MSEKEVELDEAGNGVGKGAEVVGTMKRANCRIKKCFGFDLSLYVDKASFMWLFEESGVFFREPVETKYSFT